MPVRRCALCAAAAAGQPAHLPLPHVPEGVRVVLRAADRRAAGQIRADARRARDLQELRSRPSAASAGIAERRLPSRFAGEPRISSRSARSTSRRSPAAKPVRDRGAHVVVLRRCRRRTATRPPRTTVLSSRRRSPPPNHQHPDHDTERRGRADAGMSSAVRLTGGCQCGRCVTLLARRRTTRTSAIAACARRRSGSFFAPLTACRWRNSSLTAAHAVHLQKLGPRRSAVFAAIAERRLTIHDVGSLPHIAVVDRLASTRREERSSRTIFSMGSKAASPGSASSAGLPGDKTPRRRTIPS